MHGKDRVGENAGNRFFKADRTVYLICLSSVFACPLCFVLSGARARRCHIQKSYAADWCELAVIAINKRWLCEVLGQPNLDRRSLMKMFLQRFSVDFSRMSLTSAI